MLVNMKLLHTFFLIWLGYLTCAQERLESLHPCETDEDCTPNSFCYGNDLNREGNCKCTDNYLIWRNGTDYECLLPLGFNDRCNRSVQCLLNLGSLATCGENHFCKCAEGAHFSDNRCIKTARIGEVCLQNGNCNANDKTNAFCTDGRCQCRWQHHVSPNGICVPTSHLGSPCTNEDSCVNMNATCIGGICKCKAGTVAANDEHKCLKAATMFGEPCKQLSQCDLYLLGSTCSNSRCSCPIGYHPNGNRCYRTVKIGGECNGDKECILSKEYLHSVTCDQHICACVIGVDNNLQGCTIVNGASKQVLLSFATFILCSILSIL